MSSVKAAAFVALMFALGAALDRSSQAALKELPLPWVVATLHFGAGMLWIFPAWVRETEGDAEAAKCWSRFTPACVRSDFFSVLRVSYVIAAGFLCWFAAMLMRCRQVLMLSESLHRPANKCSIHTSIFRQGR